MTEGIIKLMNSVAENLTGWRTDESSWKRFKRNFYTME